MTGRLYWGIITMLLVLNQAGPGEDTIVGIKFELKDEVRNINLNKGEVSLLWRYWHQTPEEVNRQFSRTDFELFQASQTEDHDYMMIMAEIKSSTGS